MQTRPHDGRDSVKIWLSPAERVELLETVATKETKRSLAFRLGLSGLRTEEIVGVTARDLRTIEGTDRYVLEVETAKKQAGTKREPPISRSLAADVLRYQSDVDVGIDDPLIQSKKRTVRSWIEEAREAFAERVGESDALELSMHDLRRTWATEVYYSLAFAGVPIAEQLVMSWGGWEQTAQGRAQFRRDYLGPVPDHVTERAVEHLELV